MVLLLLLVLMASAFPFSIPDATATSHLVLRVGGQDEMKTRNLLPPIANDVWTSDVLFRVYESVLLTHPTEGRPLAWIAKGVDYDEDGVFEPVTEYDVWAERAGATTSLQVTVYYDFNGVLWHDGTQMTPWDLFFSYHVNAMNPRFNMDIRALFRDGVGSSYETGERQLTIALAPKSWSGEGLVPGDATLRVAVRFSLNERFVRFYDSTLAPVLLPMHLWSRTGGGRHTDFGCAIWIPPAEATARGIPECGNPDPARHGMGIASTEVVTGSRPYDYPSAEAWLLTDADVIGHGPFRFVRWVPGVMANVVRNGEFYTGRGLGTGPEWDDRLVRLLRKPTITEIEFRVYKSTQLGLFALQQGEIDFYHWNIGPTYVLELVNHWEIAVEANAEPGYFYMGYNMRRAPWGYENDDPTQDVGFGFRQAVAHLVDKRSIVQNLLQNFGVIAHGFVSPANTFWYHDGIPKPGYDLAAANAILDDLATPGGTYYDARFTLDPPGPCHRDNNAGCRSLPVIGNTEFEILTPQADYDPIRASTGAMIADAMRQVGINAFTRSRAFGEIVSMVTIHDFDLFILGSRIIGNDPDYLYSIFSCSGLCNAYGYNSPEFEQVIGASRVEMDRGVRQGLIYRAQEILARDRPAEPLYFRTNIEAYRQDRFVNWTVAWGTIWNFWSLVGIRPPGQEFLSLGIDAETAMSSQTEVPLGLSVHGSQGESVEGARIDLVIEAPTGEDPGLLSVDGVEGRAITLFTDSAGGATATYRAPMVIESTRPIVLRASASHPDYAQGASEETFLTVFGETLNFLRVRVEFPAGDVVHPGESLPFRVLVHDAESNAVPDALVTVGIEPPGPSVPPAGQSRDLTTAMATFDSPGTFVIGVRVEKAGFWEAWGTRTVWVVEPSDIGPPTVLPGGDAVDRLPVASLIGVGIASGVTLIAAALWTRRKLPRKSGR